MYGNQDMNNGFNSLQTNIRVVLFNLYPTKESYKDVYRRSYGLNVDYQAIDNLANIFDRYGSESNNTISDVVFAQNAPNIMTLGAVPEGRADIVNGWNTQRLRFIMITESELAGSTLVSYIQGYSEYHDPSLTGLIDPDMKFFINSITNVMRTKDPISGRMMVRPFNTFNVIFDNQGNASYEETIESNGVEALKLIRPNDIIDNIKNNELYGEAVPTFDYGGNLTTNASVSDRANNNPLKHFSKTVNGFIQAKSLSEISHDSVDVLRTAANTVSETNLLDTPLISALYNLTGISTPKDFTLNILERVDPNTVPNIPSSAVMNQNAAFDQTLGMLNSTNTEDLYKQNIETIIATTIAQSVSGMMIENLLSMVAVNGTNIGGIPESFITHASSFIDGIDTVFYSNRILARINNVLMPEVTQNGLIGVSFDLVVDLIGDASINISVNGGPSILYRLPLFADSLYSPVISNATNKDLLTNDFSTVMDVTYNNTF